MCEDPTLVAVCTLNTIYTPLSLHPLPLCKHINILLRPAKSCEFTTRARAKHVGTTPQGLEERPRELKAAPSRRTVWIFTRFTPAYKARLFKTQSRERNGIGFHNCKQAARDSRRSHPPLPDPAAHPRRFAQPSCWHLRTGKLRTATEARHRGLANAGALWGRFRGHGVHRFINTLGGLSQATPVTSQTPPHVQDFEGICSNHFGSPTHKHFR